jgi:hypothetical protein
MIWTIVWSPMCDTDVRHLHPRIAERICKAVMDFASEGSGQVQSISQGKSSLLVVRARGGFALVRLDEGTKTLQVSRILPNAPLRRLTPLL